MDLQRNILIFSFLLCSFLLWQVWKIEFTSEVPVVQVKKNQNELFSVKFPGFKLIKC